MKSAAKTLLKFAARRLPWGAREAIFEALCERLGPTEALSRIAGQIGITGFSAKGAWGVIQSSAADRAVLPSYARTGVWGARTVDAFQRLFAGTGGTYLDIGANIGLTTIPIARNPRVRCIAFEPEPFNFQNLSENVRRNIAHGNVDLRCMALFDRADSLRFGLAGDGNLGDHRLVLGAATARKTIEVPATPLDALDLPIGEPLGVKIDTQGAEPFVIAGGRCTLARASLCVIEFAPALIVQLGGDPAAVIEFIGGFPRVAVVAGESSAPLDFTASEIACRRLRDFAARAQGDETKYLDVYAARSP